MNERALRRWAEKYAAMEKKSDKYWERSRKYESEGDMEKAGRAEKYMQELDDQMKGMMIALELFGYSTVYQGDELKIIEI